jgi:hypothetical protein
MADLLDQGIMWQPKDGPSLLITDMDTGHLTNLVAWLERRAVLIQFSLAMDLAGFCAGPLGPSGDGASDAAEAAMAELCGPPLPWLRGTPLYRALTAELARR